ncbi:hypothetical protein [Microbispora sp. KK1-11]|nr:hypothetical protein [Microbispora sp. KK1-11]
MKHLLIAALIGGGLVAGTGIVVSHHHGEGIVASRDPRLGCC